MGEHRMRIPSHRICGEDKPDADDWHVGPRSPGAAFAGACIAALAALAWGGHMLVGQLPS
jgi:hypothetical protein